MDGVYIVKKTGIIFLVLGEWMYEKHTKIKDVHIKKRINMYLGIGSVERVGDF